jgi:hypothetical protein
MRSKRSNRRRSRRRETTRRRSSKRVTNRRRRRSNQRVTNRRRRRSNQRVTNRRGKRRRSKKGRSGETKELYYVQTEFPYQGVGMGASIMHNAQPTNLVKITRTNPEGNVEIDVIKFSHDFPLNPDKIHHETKSGIFIGTETELKAKLVPINSPADLARSFAVREEYDEGGDTKTLFDTVWKSI